MPIVIDPNKQVTDPTLLTALTKQGIDWRYVELYQDYAPAYDIQGTRIKGRSPYAKFYRHTETNKQWMVVSQLPMVNADGIKVEVGWEKSGAKYVSKVNQFQAQVNNKTTTLTCINDQPTGQKKGNSLTYTPHLYLNGAEVSCGKETLFAVDPVNSNYQNNVLEWDYGICKRRLRLIEGRILGTWVFAQNPNGEVRIHYDQAGDFKLHLGQYAISDSEELISAKEFENPIFGYPFVISDSMTFYPDAHTETTSVDGIAGHVATSTWAAIQGGAGTESNDTSATSSFFYICTYNAGWYGIYRSIFLFDTSALPDGAIKTGATLSLYGSSKEDTFSPVIAPDINIYSSAPASNTALVAGDYDSLSAIGLSTAITYAGWSTTGYNDFALNDLTVISLTNVTKLGVRNACYDAANSAPGWQNSKYSQLAGYYTEQGTGYKPKLVVTYTADQPFRNYYPHILAH